MILQKVLLSQSLQASPTCEAAKLLDQYQVTVAQRQALVTWLSKSGPGLFTRHDSAVLPTSRRDSRAASEVTRGNQEIKIKCWENVKNAVSLCPFFHQRTECDLERNAWCSGRDPQVELSWFWLSSRLNSVLISWICQKTKQNLELTYRKGKTKVARGSMLLCCFPESSSL